MKRLSLLLVLFTIFNCADEPLESEQRNCVETTAALAEATTNFNAVTPDNYIELCNTYRIALQNQKEFCGDGSGNIQMLLDGLGDCSGTQLPADCSSAQAASTIAASNYTSDTNEDNCNAYKLALQNQITVCGDTGGNIQVIIDGLGDCTTSSVDHSALMTANLIGEQFNNLVPFFYHFFNSATSIATFSADGNTEHFLWLQGNSNPTELTDFSKEINLYIPESLWEVGTYSLEGDAFDSSLTPQAKFGINYGDGTDYNQAFEEPGGTITITEIDLISRNIKGTFEFSFTRSSATNPDIGPFDCLDGTFDYDLDDDYFN